MKPISIKIQLVVVGLVVAVMAVWALRNILHYTPDKPTKNVLRIMTYSSFMLPTGPGPIFKEDFETFCNCIIEYVDGGDSALFIETIKKLPKRNVDLVIGLSFLHRGRAEQDLKWKTMVWPKKARWVKELEPAHFGSRVDGVTLLPYSWSPMTFVFRSGELEPPTSWEDLAKSEYSQVMTAPDPRFSMPGMQLVLWTGSAENAGELDQNKLKALTSSLISLSPDWSASYGLFRKKNAKLTFSYATSPVYHWVEDKDEKYQAAVFPEGHPYEIELVGVPENCKSCILAERFALHLLEPEWQKVLMKNNYMLPVIAGVKKGSEFAKLPSFPLLSFEQLSQLGANGSKLADQFVEYLKTNTP